ncbi:hypothetical protein [Tepidibacillus marianensis]|uniref:hypothetical protein n=1 Tax=Tepidibacillus marianensis TaxID=3131995 RepID=UPI0030D59787
MEGLMDFLLYLADERQEDFLWDIWIHKDVDSDFEKFKNKYLKKSTKKLKVKSLSKVEEEVLIKRAMQFIKPKSPIMEVK